MTRLLQVLLLHVLLFVSNISYATPIKLGDLGLSAAKYVLDKVTKFNVTGTDTTLSDTVASLIESIFGVSSTKNQLPYLGVQLVEDAWTGNFSITDSRPNGSSGTVQFNGANWTGQLSLSLTKGGIFSNDDVAFTGSMVHSVGPHTDDGVGTQIGYQAEVKKGVESFVFKVGNTTQNFTYHAQNNHEDMFTGTWLTTFDGSNISSWTSTITAQHIPEPTTFSIFGLGLVVMAYGKRHKFT